MHTPTPLEPAPRFAAGSFTPAVSLTRDLPQGVDASILVLGYQDARHVLYTAFAERGFPERKLDITACEVNEHLVGKAPNHVHHQCVCVCVCVACMVGTLTRSAARDVLFYTLVLDGADAIPLAQLWNVYYHFYLDESDNRLVEAQAQKLLGFSRSLEEWLASPYGPTLRFCDQATLSRVRAVWARYADLVRDDAGGERRRRFDASLEESRQKKIGSEAPETAVFRSCAPLSVLAAQDLLEATEQHWMTGLTGPLAADGNASMVPNPVFAVPLERSVLEYPTNPLLSFHLAVIHASLTEMSPVRLDEEGISSEDPKLRLFETARLQFKEWTNAFRDAASRITLRFVAADSFALCYTLRHNLNTGETCAHWYRGPIGFDALDLADVEYGKDGNAPRQFDVIDASGLPDGTSVLNLLVSVGPLLEDAASSTLYTGSQGTGDPDHFEQLLCGHTTTISTLLGLVPVEYWTNATALSTTDEKTRRSDAPDAAGSGHSSFVHRVAWKRSDQLTGPHTPIDRLVFKAEGLLVLAEKVYRSMLQHKPVIVAPWPPTASVSNRVQDFQHHSGSFVAFLRAICRQAHVDFTRLCGDLIHRLRGNGDLPPEQSHLDELAVEAIGPSSQYLMPLLSKEPKQEARFCKWTMMPNVLAITLVVPAERWTQMLGHHPPSAVLGSHFNIVQEDGSRRRRVYSDIQISFGRITTRGSPDEDSYTVIAHEDEGGWNGTSPLIVTTYIPTVTVRANLQNAEIGFHVAMTDSNSDGPEDVTRVYTIFEASVLDQDHVFITKHRPGQVAYPIAEAELRPGGSAEGETPPAGPTFSADFDADTGDIVTITGHLDITSEKGKQLLTDKVKIVTQQSSPFTIDIIFGRKTLVLSMTYPLPVVKEGSKTRIARKSSYIEIVAPLAKPLTPLLLDHSIFPVTLLKPFSIPATLNIPHLNLDTLPILALDDKKRIRFLTTLTSSTFSFRERQLRDEASQATNTGISSSARLNFKESLFTMFMLASGLQGGQTGLFSITHPHRGGKHMLLFVSAIRLDSAHGSVVLDAAVLPITKQLIASRELESFLLMLKVLECCELTVDDAELALWRKTLPAFAERCRTWEHEPATCEYAAAAHGDVSAGAIEQVLCSCGRGRLPPDFMPLPEWDTALPHATRIAISPAFASSLVEQVPDPVQTMAAAGDDESYRLKACRNCGKTEETEGVKLKKCLRCLEVVYCSSACQKTDWKKHRRECEEADIYQDE